MAESRCAGHAWYENGQSAFSGPALALYQRLDAAFVRLARRMGAEDHAFPTMIPAAALARIDYFRSFPQLATFAATLHDDDANLDRFRADADEDAAAKRGLVLTQLAPVRDVLTPAACYHFYHLFEGRRLEQPLRLTTRATCHRRETHYLPLRRQWSFGMREIVCIGTEEEVAAFLESAKQAVPQLLAALGLAADPQPATDPFFRPTRNPQWLMQRLDPVKTEFVFRGDLAVASANLHHDHFGRAFGIAREGVPAHSACLAFGIERWIHMILEVHGSDPSAWPVLDAIP